MARYITVTTTDYFTTDSDPAMNVAGDLQVDIYATLPTAQPVGGNERLFFRGTAWNTSCWSMWRGVGSDLIIAQAYNATSTGTTFLGYNTTAFDTPTLFSMRAEFTGSDITLSIFEDGTEKATNTTVGWGSSIVPVTETLYVAGLAAGGEGFAGDVRYAEMMDGLGGAVVARVDADDAYAAHGAGTLANGATWTGSVDGLTWTVNGTGATVVSGPGAGTYAGQEALGAIRNRLILDGSYTEATAPREIVGALNAFLGTSAGDIEGALNEANGTTDLGVVEAANQLETYRTAYEVNDALRMLAETYDP